MYTRCYIFIGQRHALARKIHVEIHVCCQGFSDVAFDWLTAVLPANQVPGLKAALPNIDLTSKFLSNPFPRFTVSIEHNSSSPKEK